MGFGASECDSGSSGSVGGGCGRWTGCTFQVGYSIWKRPRDWTFFGQTRNLVKAADPSQTVEPRFPWEHWVMSQAHCLAHPVSATSSRHHSPTRPTTGTSPRCRRLKDKQLRTRRSSQFVVLGDVVRRVRIGLAFLVPTPVRLWGVGLRLCQVETWDLPWRENHLSRVEREVSSFHPFRSHYHCSSHSCRPQYAEDYSTTHSWTTEAYSSQPSKHAKLHSPYRP